MPSPEQLRDAARGLRVYAAAVPELLSGVAAVLGPSVWLGDAADRLAEELAQGGSLLEGARGSLLATAAGLDVKAAALEVLPGG